MQRVGRTGGWALIGIGLLVGLLPFVSVWRTSGMVLEQLPEITSPSGESAFGARAS